METLILSPNRVNIKKAASILKSGEVVAVPTETVYGLAANHRDKDAISKIFKVKGRKQDNPLIVHIGNNNMLYELVQDICPIRKRLISAFWPGALTLVFKKSESVFDIVTGFSDTVAVRFPANDVMVSLINECGFALAAPSANVSGKPSPTRATHVYDDLKSKIPIILDGGNCEVGVESTVVNVEGDNVYILRPGKITSDDIKCCLGNVQIVDVSLSSPKTHNKIISPGMKYKHYSPKANVVLVKSSFENFKKFLEPKDKNKNMAIVFESEDMMLDFPCISYGKESDFSAQAKSLFDILRHTEKFDLDNIYVRCPAVEGMGVAVYNRLIRAADFEVVEIE